MLSVFKDNIKDMKDWLNTINLNCCNKELEYSNDGFMVTISTDNSIIKYNKDWDTENITDSNFKYIIIDLIEIESDERNQGLGTAIMHTLINFAKENNITKVCLLVDGMYENSFNLIN